jgi:hypothetical protein
MKHGFAETLLLISALLMVIGSLMLVNTSHVTDAVPIDTHLQ